MAAGSGPPDRTCIIHYRTDELLEYVVEQVLDAHVGQAVSGEKFDGADWWSRGASCYPMGEEHMAEERR
jgi:hypothetical protein